MRTIQTTVIIIMVVICAGNIFDNRQVCTLYYIVTNKIAKNYRQTLHVNRRR